MGGSGHVTQHRLEDEECTHDNSVGHLMVVWVGICAIIILWVTLWHTFELARERTFRYFGIEGSLIANFALFLVVSVLVVSLVLPYRSTIL
jgi:predicted nucleic acid-binding Zn ribbon protein